MHPRLTALVVVGILLAGSCGALLAQAPRTVEQAPAPTGSVRARAQIPVQVQRMPNLVGQTFQAARQDSRVIGLKLQLTGRPQPSTDYKPGVIVGHEPGPGSAVRPGMQVTVFVAVPPPDTAGGERGRTELPPPRMPNLVGQPFDRAQQDSRVADLKLRLIAREQATSDRKAGTIIRHEPEPGDPVRPGSSVVAIVAVAEQQPPDRGRDTVKDVEVPRVVKMQAKDGASLLARRTLNAQAQFTDASRVEPGTIVDQKPAPGTRVPPNSTVLILVARARPDPPPEDVGRMPNLIGQPFGAAVRDSRVIDLKLRLIAREQITSDRKPGTIVRHEPTPGSAVKPGTEVTAFVAVAEPQTPPNPVQGVRVPRVEGLDAREGLSILSKVNLGARTQAVDTDRAAPGTIVDQNPEAGTLVVPPFTVTVSVARRPPPDVGRPPDPPPPIDPTPPPPQVFPMPNLVGRAFPLAERDPGVTQLQLRLNQQIDSQAGGLPNTIVRQSVRPGDLVPIGQAVTVFVASGVAVPRVVQQQADAASQRIVAAGLSPRRTEETSEVTPGTVLRQVPDPGVLVARGAAVGITVAVPPKVVIPNLVGRTRADAVQELTRLRLRASPADDEASLLPPEQVVAQVPIAGTEVVVGAAVRIAVATGVEVPNLSGLSADAAQRAVAERGLSFEDADQETDAAPPGQVFQQQPASGARVTRGSRVLATVAVPVPIAVPSVIGLPRQRAVAILEAAGLRVGPEPDATASGRLVERQAPAANARVARLTTIALFVAAPPPPPVQPPPAQPAVPAPVPGPVLTPPPAVQVDPPPAVPVVQGGGGATPPPAQNGGATPGPVAVPATPLLPPWLLSLLVAAVAIGVSTFKLWWPSSTPPPPPVHVSTPSTPPAPAVDVRPERGDAALRLEVLGRSLISMDVRVRVGQESAEQSLNVEGEALVAEERRLYE